MKDLLKKIGIFCIVFILLLILANVLLRFILPVTPTLVTTDAMRPAYNKFDIVFRSPSDHYGVGDVVIVRITNTFSGNVEDVITRIIKINSDNTYTTKMDANRRFFHFEDHIKQNQIKGKVIFSTKAYVYYPLIYSILIILAFLITKVVCSKLR